MTIAYDDLDLYPRWRISHYMHAVYARAGRDRDKLRKAAEDCARWYDVDTQAVIRVWRVAYPEDLVRMYRQKMEEGECQQN